MYENIASKWELHYTPICKICVVTWGQWCFLYFVCFRWMWYWTCVWAANGVFFTSCVLGGCGVGLAYVPQMGAFLYSCVLGGCGIGLAYMPPLANLIRWFPDRVRRCIRSSTLFRFGILNRVHFYVTISSSDSGPSTS